VPCNSDEIAPSRKIAIIYDDRPKLEERLYRLGTKFAHSQRPKSLLSRSITNIVLGEDYHPATGGSVTSRFVLAEVRNEEQRFWAGRSQHVLARENGRLLMKEKIVYLLANDLPLSNMTFII
jgi:3-phenylpropionate/cinnamic acid dioxygenase small subunit